MKNMKMTVLMMLALMATASSGWSQIKVPNSIGATPGADIGLQATSGSGGTWHPGTVTGGITQMGLISGAGKASIVLTPLLLAAQPSPAWGIGADSAIDDSIITGWATNTASSTPNKYTVCGGRINAFNLMYSLTTHLWDDILNPTGAYANEFGHDVWCLVDVNSASGNDDISLDSLIFTSTSNDGNVLGGGTLTFTGDTYTSRCRLVKASGTVVTSGAASQMGKRIVFLVKSKLFNGGATQQGIDQVKNWVQGQITANGDYILSFAMQIVGDNATLSTARVSVLPTPAIAPRLIIVRVGNRADVSIANAEQGRLYQLYSRAQVTGPVRFEGVWDGSTHLSVPFVDPARFFTVRVQ